ncbi:hypothetical protein [Ralstonia solanacearum]|uniref:hypothetical protein n=1 Tax=Ralstonia solanacearum TaxID=305 RepID=UPI003D8035A7
MTTDNEQQAELSAETAFQTLKEVLEWTDEDWSELFECYPGVRERALRQATKDTGGEW